MLGIMRKYKQSIIIKGVFAVIVLSFIGTIFLVWGQGGKGPESGGYAVKVDNTKVSFNDFQRDYERMRNMYQQFSQQPLTPEMEKLMGLKKMALENIVNTTLMRNAAEKMDIKVSKQDIIEAIAAIPAFQKNGAFDSQLYNRLLQANRLTPDSFENSVKEELLLKKAQKQITDKVKVSDEEALRAFKKQHDKVDLLFASISPSDVRSEIKLTDKDLSTYLQNHQDQFRIPERISISYVMVASDKVAAGISVSSDETQTFYSKNIDRYQEKGNILPFDKVKERVAADALKFKAANKAYELAAEALNKNLKSADLNGAARMLGLKIEKTPLFTAQQPPAALAGETELIQRAFILKTGELGGPVETKKGVYLFTINEKKPAEVPPLEQIRTKVEKLAADDGARELARKKADDELALIAKGKTPAGLRDTGPFPYSATAEIPGIGKSPEIMEAAFDLTKASPVAKAPIKSGENWYVIKLKNRLEADTSDFQKTKEQIKQSMLPAKQQEAVANWVKELRSKAEVEINPSLLNDN
jgi:peptidyl-prolyl cis-trans isomerase D